jgi:peptidoglycan/xylan/chitin deacetylase (PgdA/CDA1 family)|tara:strand:- start:81 stop:887 length:807 start_codon:yes stop_codon:yes gene_type:complete
VTKKLILKKWIAQRVRHGKGLLPIAPEQNTIRVLMYHSIPATDDLQDAGQMTTPFELFKRQMAYLSEHRFNVISCRTMTDLLANKQPIPLRSVVITFDDGFRNNLSTLPVLEEYGFPAMFFLSTHALDGEADYLSWSEAERLAHSSRFSIGSHSVSHRNLKRLDEPDVRDEIFVSKQKLEERLQEPIEYFAIPFGSYGAFDGRTRRLLQSAGFVAAFSTIAGVNSHRSDLFALRRTRISWFDDMTTFPDQLSGYYDWYRWWQKMSKSL